MPSTQNRLVSLDALRGYTVAAMIMVNFPGSEEHVFFTLRHTIWNGLSFTDQVAPFFLFIIGISISFAFQQPQQNGLSKAQLHKKILVRAIKIFAIGMFLNAMPAFDLASLRYTGTLHRIAIVYAITAMVFLHSNWKQQAILCGMLLIGYWIIMLSIPTPDEGKVMLEPGRNLAAYIDRLYLPGKMWQGNWDPEGILSTVPCVATCLLGVLAGHLMSLSIAANLKLNYLMSAGVITAVMGYFVSLSFPVNENLWSSSFVLVTAGFASLAFAVFYFFADVLGHQRWCRPGVIFGVNAITAYILGDVFSLLFYQLPLGSGTLNRHVVNWLIAAGLSPDMASWCYALLYVCIVFIPLYFMYRKKIFIKL
jgi:predicted acyltransferase